MAIHLSEIVRFFEKESRLVERGDNAYRSSRLEGATYDHGFLSGHVKSSLKDRTYTVEVNIWKLLFYSIQFLHYSLIAYLCKRRRDLPRSIHYDYLTAYTGDHSAKNRRNFPSLKHKCHSVRT